MLLLVFLHFAFSFMADKWQKFLVKSQEEDFGKPVNSSEYNNPLSKINSIHEFYNCFTLETKNTADHDESPPRTPTGNAPSSESDIDISSPNVSHDESIAKDMSLKDSGSDLSHRPKRRRFHESYNFNMKCPTPGCNSLGKCAPTS